MDLTLAYGLSLMKKKGSTPMATAVKGQVGVKRSLSIYFTHPIRIFRAPRGFAENAYMQTLADMAAPLFYSLFLNIFAPLILASHRKIMAAVVGPFTSVSAEDEVCGRRPPKIPQE